MLQWNHLSNVCMTYWVHMRFSLWIARRLAFGAVRAFVHAVFPPLYSKETTKLLVDLKQAIASSGCCNSL